MKEFVWTEASSRPSRRASIHYIAAKWVATRELVGAKKILRWQKNVNILTNV
jgi:hypothetical protein